MNDVSLHSALYTGTVRHRRFSPRAHAFQYNIFMPYLDLDEVEHIFKQSRFCSLEKFNLASMRRQDFSIDDGFSLKQSIINIATNTLGKLPIQSVRLLSNLRYFGIQFNPISTYYCFDAQENLLCTVAEVTNTPWFERHHYVIPNGGEERVSQHIFPKDFHVSPFMDMDMHYKWKSNSPEEKLFIHMENLSGEEKVFDATMTLNRQPLSATALDKKILAYPFMSLKVVTSIYWQALKLYLKKTPLYDHPVFSANLSSIHTPQETHNE